MITHTMSRRLIFMLLLSNERVKHAILQTHPFPERSSCDLDWRDNLVLQFTCHRVNQLTGTVIADVQRRGRSNERIAMYHHPRRQIPLPKNCAVVAVKRNEFIEVWLFPLFEGNMSESLEHTTCRSYCHLRHWRVSWVCQKLRQIGCPSNAVFRLWIVVRTVIWMAPIIDSWGK